MENFIEAVSKVPKCCGITRYRRVHAMKQLANTCNGLHVDIASSLEHLLDLCRDFLSVI